MQPSCATPVTSTWRSTCRRWSRWRPTDCGCGSRWSSSRWRTVVGSTCWPRDAWSTSPLQKDGELENQVYTIPDEIDQEIARLKLESMGVQIDSLSEEQARYLASWEEGT